VRLAARGTRDLDRGEDAVSDRVERDVLRRHARRVHGQAIVVAVFGTALALGLRLLVGVFPPR
jgi:hypothetical protein